MSNIFPSNYTSISTKSEDDVMVSTSYPLISRESPSEVIKIFHDFKVPEDGTLKLPDEIYTLPPQCCDFKAFVTSLPFTMGAEDTFVLDHYFAGVQIEDALEITKDFQKFIEVMLQGNNGTDLQGRWDKAHEVFTYVLDRSQGKMIIAEKVVPPRWVDVEGRNEWLLEWSNVSFSPQQPLRNYRSYWKLIRRENGTRLQWTRFFQKPHLFGLVDFSSNIKSSLIESGGSSIKAFDLYYGALYPSRLPKYTDKILIVGGGPSGLHMAHVLIKRGYNPGNILIVEKSSEKREMINTDESKVDPEDNDTYGKTFSIADSTSREVIEAAKNNPATSDLKIQSVVHELGTCYLHPAYFAVRELFKELQRNSSEANMFHEVGPDSYIVRRPGQLDESLEGWIASMIKDQVSCSPFALCRALCPAQDSKVELMLAKNKYNQIHRKYFGEYYFSMPPPLPTEALGELDVSFMKFLVDNGLEVLVPILAYGQTCQGYGSIEKTPAFWAMCWITPDLLDGYFSIRANYENTCLSRNKQLTKKYPWYPKKTMLVNGWSKLWREIKRQDKLTVLNGVEVTKLHRPCNEVSRAGEQRNKIVASVSFDGGRDVIYADFLIVAAPIHLISGVMTLTEEEKNIYGEYDNKKFSVEQAKNIENGTFRTTLFRTTQPQPYLDAHLTIYPQKIVGPDVGSGEVFATRDSYLAVNKEFCAGPESLSLLDPFRPHVREQMAYQYVENGIIPDHALLDEKFKTWADEQIGENNYEIIIKPELTTWNYFYRFKRDSILSRKLWGVFSLQGRNNSMFVHASSYFESVLDIVNYNNMMIECFTGKFNNDCNYVPETCYKPKIEDSLSYTCMWYFTIGPLALLNMVLNALWFLYFCLMYPFNQYIFYRWSRWHLQKAFKTDNLGHWTSYTMKKFIDISPSVIALNQKVKDPIVEKLYENRENIAKNFPGIKEPVRSLEWNFQDFRLMVAEWLRIIEPEFLTFFGSSMISFITWLYQTFPITYQFFFSWIAAVAFSHITGYGYKKDDLKGGGYYVPKCTMLTQARKDYGVEVGNRICTHVCKIFTEEFMKKKGLQINFEPNLGNCSCMVRSVASKNISCSDNSLYEW